MGGDLEEEREKRPKRDGQRQRGWARRDEIVVRVCDDLTGGRNFGVRNGACGFSGKERARESTGREAGGPTRFEPGPARWPARARQDN